MGCDPGVRDRKSNRVGCSFSAHSKKCQRVHVIAGVVIASFVDVGFSGAAVACRRGFAAGRKISLEPTLPQGPINYFRVLAQASGNLDPSESRVLPFSLMPILGRSLLDTRTLSSNDIDEIFLKADALAPLVNPSDRETRKTVLPMRQPVVCCLFFEPSTRTRMSFQMAAYRLGCQVLTMELSAGSSLSKGETLTDTVLNFAAMKPDVLVVRYGTSRELDELLPTLEIPVINAGSGTMAHPTQGLLDAYTLRSEWETLRAKKVLIFGDVLHSRVARSGFDVLTKLGANIGLTGPEKMMPQGPQREALSREFGLQFFDSLEEGLPWADAVMGLRVQLERHEAKELDLEFASDYHDRYGLNEKRMDMMKPGAVILHPGPINHGVEFAPGVVRDARSRVLAQVTNGVTVRAALLDLILGLGIGGER